MSKGKRRKGTLEIRRLSDAEFGIGRERLAELKAGCRGGMIDRRTLHAACKGFEWLTEYILMAVISGKGYDTIEYTVKLGQIPCCRNTFYKYHKLFFANLDCLLKKETCKNKTAETKGLPWSVRL